LYANKSSVELIQKSAKLELAQLEDSVFYDKLERARRQTTNRISLMSNVLSQGQDIITVISLITGLIVFEPWLIVLLFIAIIPSFINEIKFSRTSYSLQRSWTPERRELDYLRFIGASDQTAKEVKLFGLANYISTKFAEVAHRYYLANRKLSIQRSLWGSLFNIIGDVAYYWAYLVIIMQTVSGIITIGAMTFLSGSFSRLRGQLQTIFSRFSRITESAMYLQDYFDFIDIETEEDRTEVFQKIPEKIQTGFSFENVSFKYPESEKFVLKNITFSLKKGEKLALVGENGAGKTTLVKLLLRMYEPDEGRILLDGKDIRNYPKSEYQQLFGAIFQDFVKYYFTAGENIGIGYVKEIENRPRVEISAEKSLADKVIADLPENYNQRLGKRFNDGKDLSGGQWQKIALGRAYMKDAEIIVLDEPTAALDARAEYEAFERFVELTKGKTSVIISHRFSTVRMAERILVLKNGTILELGSHEDLLANEGLYAELFELQAKGYQ
jgi:ATP-binding cassette subfamily B protein